MYIYMNTRIIRRDYVITQTVILCHPNETVGVAGRVGDVVVTVVHLCGINTVYGNE